VNDIFLTFTNPAQVSERLRRWMALSTKTVFTVMYCSSLQ